MAAKKPAEEIAFTCRNPNSRLFREISVIRTAAFS